MADGTQTNTDDIIISNPPDPFRLQPCDPCPSECENPFDRVVVSYLTHGGTHVMWNLRDDFLDKQPLTFQLQYGMTANPDANDWLDVGLPVTDNYLAVDGEQRAFAKFNTTYYRVQLTTSKGTYYSVPVNAMGALNWTDWRHAREIIRRELKEDRFASVEGFLLKRRLTGIPCQNCMDDMTDDTVNPDCPICYGTRFECGYYFPMACSYAQFSPRTVHVERDGARGTITDIAVVAKMTLMTLLMEEDIWVNRFTDERYYIHSIRSVAEIRSVPILGNVEMRPIPASSPVYGIVIPNQIPGAFLDATHTKKHRNY